MTNEYDFKGAEEYLRRVKACMDDDMVATIQAALRIAERVQSGEIAKLLNSIARLNQYEGIHGCTYGDTQYQSVDAAYGYNDLLNFVQPKVNEVLQLMKEVRDEH